MAPPIPKALESLARRRSVEEGTILFLQGDPADRCYYLEGGEVALRQVSRAGGEVEVARIEPGEWFGEAVLFADQGFPVQAVVVRASRVLEFPKAALVSSLNPQVSGFFLNLLARKCLGLNLRIQQLTVMDARERVARYLLGLVGPRSSATEGEPERRVLSLPKKKVEVARELAMAPETLSRTLGQLERDGFLTMNGTQVVVASVPRLERLVE